LTFASRSGGLIVMGSLLSRQGTFIAHFWVCPLCR
jgi:hypothetical protein